MKNEKPLPTFYLTFLIMALCFSNCSDTERFVIGGKPFALGAIILAVFVLLVVLSMGVVGVWLIVSAKRESHD
jgi:hypothetical protein